MYLGGNGMKRILITGGSGQLGYDIYREVNKRYGDDVTVLMPNHAVLDITNESEVNELIDSFEPHIVFHAAAFTKVDAAESNEDVCFDTNVYATQVIAEACERMPNLSMSVLIMSLMVKKVILIRKGI